MRVLPVCLVFLAAAPLSLHAQRHAGVTPWVTDSDKSALFDPLLPPLPFSRPRNQDPTIVVDESQTFQAIDGFGFALTGRSAQLMIRMEAASRAALIQELFGVEDKDIGISSLRLSIGSPVSDDLVSTCDDMPAGQTDPTLARFSLDEDRKNVIPVLREILKVNPQIQILASPWTAPSWMKTGSSPKGGTLKPEFYPLYAQYLVKYIQGMRAVGIPIGAVTVLDEPLDGRNAPGMLMPAAQEADFIARHLGPAFKKARIKTKIVIYSRNCGAPESATSILGGAAARYVDGSSFHYCAGSLEAMTKAHNAYPHKNLYFTGQMAAEPVESSPVIDAGSPVRLLIIGATRNWSRNVLLSDLADGPQNRPPAENGGCRTCQGAITIDGNAVTRNLAYYVAAHASRFVRPGSVRIGSNNLDTLPNVAFKTPAGKIVLIVANTAPTDQSFNIHYRDAALLAKLKPNSAATYVW